MRHTQRRLSPPLARLGRLLLLAAMLLSSLGGLAVAEPAAAAPGPLIVYGPGGFAPAELTVAPGTTVTWRNAAPAPLTLRAGLPGRVFLPLLARPGAAAQAPLASARPGPEPAAGPAFPDALPPGGEYSFTFGAEGEYPFFAFDTGFRGGVSVAAGDIEQPPSCEQAPPPGSAQGEAELPGLLYATAADRTLLRWYWDDCASAEFAVYRSVNGGREQRVATVTPVTDPAAAERLLNSTDPRWPNLANYFNGRLLTAADLGADVDVSELYHYLYTSGLAGVQLSNQYYPLALMLGWGYLDTDITPGASYVYRVEALRGGRDGGPRELGRVSLIAGQPTPLPAPAGLEGAALDLAPRDGDWSLAQRNRRYHAQTYLRIAFEDAPSASQSAAPAIGYDIFRATALAPDGAILDAEKVLPDDAGDPDALVVPGPTGGVGPDYDFRYTPGDYVEHSYCAAPRDLLNQAIRWPEDAARCSPPARVAAADFQPPAPPQDVRAGAQPNSTRVGIRWGHADPADVARFVIQRSQGMHCAGAPCWDEVGTVGGDATSWTDLASPCANDPKQHAGCWYRVEARDAAGNRSAPSQAVYALNRDTAPPAPIKVLERPCQAGTPSAPECIDIQTTAVSVRVNCRLSPGGDEIFIAEIGPAQYVGLSLAELIRGVYMPPLHLEDVACRLIGSDEYGNLTDLEASPLIAVAVPSDNPDQLARPVITQIETSYDEVAGWQATVRWEIPDHPMLGGFEVERVRDGHPGAVNVALGDASVRHFKDSVQLGERYTYTVRAVPTRPEINETVSEPHSQRILPGEDRPLVELAWSATSPQPGPGAGRISMVVMAGPLSDKGPIFYAVFRSLRADRNFTQITPILETTEGFIAYTDTQAQRPCYFYSVVTFRSRDGEPSGYTDPRQPAGCLQAVPATYAPGPDAPAPAPPAPLCAPAQHSLDPGYDFRFGGGLRVAVEGLNERYTGPARVDGGGWLLLETAGQTIPAPMSFEELTVDSAGRVCSGTATVNLSGLPGGGLIMQAPGGWRYRLRSVTLRPWFAATNSALATLDLYSGSAFTNFDGVGEGATRIELVGAELLRSLRFSYSESFQRRAGHSCAAPAAAFRLETLPLDIIPTGQVSIDEQSIALTGACTRYVDRFNPAGGTMVSPPNLGPGPRRSLNDGYLAAPLFGQAVSLSPAGLDGDFSNAADLEWYTAYPYAVRVRVSDGVELSIADGQIVGGSTGAGDMRASYHQAVTGGTAAVFHRTFDGLTIGPRGGLSGGVGAGKVSYSDFSILPSPADDWTFYSGALTTPGLPATHDAEQRGQAIMWQAAPLPPSPVNLPDGTALAGLVEPGFNLRRAGASLEWANCGDPATFANVGVDVYLRLGGLSQRVVPVYDEASSMSVHGYRFIPERFALHFLDNALLERDIRGLVDLPFPSDIEVPLRDIWLTGDIDDPDAGEAACIGGGRVPAAEEGHTLAYWEVQTGLRSAEFRQTPADPAYDLPAETVLWFQGELRELPHLRIGDGPAVLPAELAFDPDGAFHDDDANGPRYDRPDYRFQGFPYLLERLRLSDWLGAGLGEAPAWAEGASAQSAPSAASWSSHGFVGLRGVPFAPYFGPVEVAPSLSSGDTQAVLAWDESRTGFASQPRVSKEWVKLARVNLTFDYDQLVHSYDAASGEGRFVGFKPYRFVPDDYALPMPALPALPAGADIGSPLQVLILDTGAVIEPGATNVYLGLSSGVAALRALTPDEAESLPSLGAQGTLAGRLGLGAAADDYIEQLGLLWAQHPGFAYAQTTQLLDGLQLPQLIDRNYVGGRTQGLLALRGVNVRRLRGVVELEGEGLEVQFRRFHLSTQLEIKGRNQALSELIDPPALPGNPALAPEPPLFYAERMTLAIERHGDFSIVGKDVSSSKFADTLDSFDAALVINATAPQFEGGLTLNGLSTSGLTIDQAAAVLGVGADVNYLGLSFDATLGVGGLDEAHVGGDLLAGVVDPNSLVLQNTFADAIAEITDDLGDSVDVGELDEMAGFYLRAYGAQIPIIGNGCALSLKGDAELALWYWQTDGGENAGGLLKPAVYGEVLCTVQARGALRLEYQHSNGADSFVGEGYVAGGLGICEPESWGDWDARWWGDGACLQAGAGLSVSYASGDGWSVSYGFDRERLGEN